MQTSPPATRCLPGIVERRSTRAAFLLTGFGMACWAPLVPYARDRLHLNEAALGLLLLCLGLGSMVTMPLAGALAARLGCRRVIAGALSPAQVPNGTGREHSVPHQRRR